MAADIVAAQYDPALQQESLALMDDYASMLRLTIMASQVALRDQIISEAQAAMVARQTVTEQYAAATGHPLPTPLSAMQKIATWQQMVSGTYQPVITDLPMS